MGAAEISFSKSLVAAAIASGYRHFDTAPAYGLGLSENALGEALSGYRQQVTITTKFGVPRPKHGTIFSIARRVVRKTSSNSTNAPEANNDGPTGPASEQEKPKLNPIDLERSVVESLRRLRTDYLDALLLHEVEASALSDDLLLKLDKLCKKGMILSFGIATGKGRSEEILLRFPQYCEIVQSSWNAFDVSKGLGGALNITHRSIMGAHVRAKSWIENDKGRAKKLSNEISVDLFDSEILAALLVAAAIAQNPDGIVLVSSKRTERIQRYGALNSEEKNDFIKKGQRFHLALTSSTSQSI